MTNNEIKNLVQQFDNETAAKAGSRNEKIRNAAHHVSSAVRLTFVAKSSIAAAACSLVLSVFVALI